MTFPPQPSTSSQPDGATVRPLVVGHRGAPSHRPENTLAAFQRALDDGAQVVECDVHLSADGHVVVMHDETIDRTADASSPLRTGAIADLTRAELDRVILPGDQHVPSLAELLEMTTVPVFIEVKAATAADAVAELLGTLPAGAPAAASTVISFHPEALSTIRRDAPQVPVSYLVRQVDEAALATAAELGAVAVGPSIRGLSLATADAGRAAGLQLNPWTINRPEQLDVALACGVDTITTDDPAWVHRELDARGL